MVTRAKVGVLVEYDQQRHNDAYIRKVLSYFQKEDPELFSNNVALELQHTISSMETRNVSLWDNIFWDEAWRLVQPIQKGRSFGSIHPGGTFPSEKSIAVIIGEVLAHLREIYGD